MPQFTEKQKAQQAVDDLNVSKFVIDSITTPQLVEDVESLAALLVLLAGKFDEQACLFPGLG